MKASAVAEDCKTDEDACRLVRDLLPQNPYLWLIDDLPEDATKEQIEAWLAPTERGHSLITTRNQKIDWLGQIIHLGCLFERDALDLLTRGRPLSGTELQAAEAICHELLGGHALSVDVAGALYPDVYGTYGELYEALKGKDAATLALSDELELILPTGHEPSILRTFAIALDSLKTRADMQVLCLAALLAPNQPIPRILLDASLSEHQAEDIGLSIAKLRHRSLCQSDGQGGMILHPVPGIVVRGYYGQENGTDALGPLKQQAQEAFIRIIREKSEREPLSCAHFPPHGEPLARDSSDQKAMEVQYALWLCLQNGGACHAARQVAQTLWDHHIRVYGPEHPDTLICMNNQASTLKEQGDHDGARELEEQVLAARRRVLGPEHPDTLTSMNNQASTLKEQGDHDGARELEEQVLEVRRRVLGPEHPSTLTSMNNLAGTLWMQEDHGGARELEEQALEVRRRVSGPEHPDTLTSMSNLASTLQAQGDNDGARELQEQVLAVRRRILGPEHPDTLSSMNNLASTLWAQGDHAGVRTLLEQVCEVSRRVLGPEHPDTRTFMNNLALIVEDEAERSAVNEGMTF